MYIHIFDGHCNPIYTLVILPSLLENPMSWFPILKPHSQGIFHCHVLAPEDIEPNPGSIFSINMKQTSSVQSVL